MTSPYTPAQFYAADGTANWLVSPSVDDGDVAFAASATFATGSFERGAEFVRRINDLANAANHHPDVELTYPAVTVRLTTHDVGSSVTDLDASLARQISKAAGDLGIEITPATTPIEPDHVERIVTRKLGAIATTYPDGRTHISTVIFNYRDGTIRASLTDTRVKVRHMRRDPRITMHIVGEDGFSWVAAEGIALLSPVTVRPDDPTADELVEIYQAVGGQHDNWDEFRSAMIAEKRLVMHLVVTRTYGNP